MMAGPTTQASSAIGAVTEAQMARILIKEYCLLGAGCSLKVRRRNLGVCHVFSVGKNEGSAHRPAGSRLPAPNTLRGLCSSPPAG